MWILFSCEEKLHNVLKLEKYIKTENNTMYALALTPEIVQILRDI